MLDVRPDDGESDATQAHKSTKYAAWSQLCLPLTAIIFLVMILGIVVGFVVTVWIAYVRFPQYYVGEEVDHVINYAFFIPSVVVAIFTPLVAAPIIRWMYPQA